MTAHRFIVGLAAGGAVLWAMGTGCASISDQASDDPTPCVGPSCLPIDASTDKKAPEASLPEAAPDSPVSPQVNVLCGDVEQCTPDYASSGACAEIDTDGGAGPEAGAADGGFDLDDDASPFTPPNGADTPDTPAAAFGCQVTSGQEGEPVSVCMPAGAGQAGAPCVMAADCAAGFACVGDANAAQCRPYCCASAESCPAETFCAERPLREADGGAPLSVPVCVRADNCNLAEPYPCPPGATCVCEGNTACMLVRDKTTSCVPPGTGQENDSCPCAWGHMCSKSVNLCLKLCSTASSKSECGAKKCTPMPYLPTGWGVCTP
jgi:hypothetical protein